MQLDYVISEAKPHDEALIYDSWLSSMRRAPMYNGYSTTRYYEAQHPAITELLARSKALVARPPDWAEGVMAWAVGEQRRGAFILHGMFVKAWCRRQGLARALVQAMAPQGELLYSAGRPPFTRILDERGYRHEPRAFPRAKEKTA